VQWRNPSAPPRAQPAAAPRPQRRRRPSVDDSDSEEEEEDDEPQPRRRRRRPRSPSSFDALNYLDEERGGQARRRAPEAFKEQRMEWWRADTSATKGGIMGWIRSFYNTIFWYGVAFDDDDSLPAMDFKDLMEQYETSSDRRRTGLQRSDPAPRRAAAVDQRSGRRRSTAGDAMRAVRSRDSEKEESPDWQFRWNPGQRSGSTRDAATQTPAAAAAGSSSRRRSRSSRERGGADLYSDDFDEDSYDEEPVVAQQQQQRKRRQQQPQQQPQQQRSQSYDSDADADASADDSRLRKRARDLLAKQQAFEADLAKVEERLSVLDATLELWLRRGRALAAQSAAAAAAVGNSAGTATTAPAATSNAEVVSTKRRIYALREEGRALEAARTQLLHRLENTSANLARLRGDDAIDDDVPTSSSSSAQRDVDSDVSDDELTSADTSAAAAAAAEPAVNGAAAAAGSASSDSSGDTPVMRVDAVVVTEPSADN
jgi:hypothetical protein